MIENNVVINICVWNGDTSQWTPPAGCLLMPQATTPALIWLPNADKTDYVLTEQMGAGAIDFTWDGTNCVTNLPKPEALTVLDQPITEGTTPA